MPVKYNDSKNTKPLNNYYEEAKSLPKKRGGNKKSIAGQAFTRYECAICAEIGTHHNTAVPKVCRKCANKLNVCETCGEIMVRD